MIPKDLYDFNSVIKDFEYLKNVDISKESKTEIQDKYKKYLNILTINANRAIQDIQNIKSYAELEKHSKTLHQLNRAIEKVKEVWSSPISLALTGAPKEISSEIVLKKNQVELEFHQLALIEELEKEQRADPNFKVNWAKMEGEYKEILLEAGARTMMTRDGWGEKKKFIQFYVQKTLKHYTALKPEEEENQILFVLFLASLEENKSFQKNWNQLSLTEQQMINNTIGEQLSGIKDRTGKKLFLKTMSQWMAALSEYGLVKGISSLAFKYFDVSSKTLNKFLDRGFALAQKYKDSDLKKAQNIVQYTLDILNKPPFIPKTNWTTASMERYMSILEKLCSDREVTDILPKEFSNFNLLGLLEIYAKSPEIIRNKDVAKWEQDVGFSHAAHYFDEAGEERVVDDLLHFSHQFSPALSALFDSTSISHERAKKAIPILEWIRNNFRAEHTTASVKRNVDLLDKIVVLMETKPYIADILLNLPVSEYSFWETFLKNIINFEIISEATISAACKTIPSLNDVFKNALRERVFNRISDAPQVVQEGMIQWINTILEMSGISNPSPNLLLLENIKNISSTHLMTFLEVLDSFEINQHLGKNPEFVKRLMGFCVANPYSEAIEKYLSILPLQEEITFEEQNRLISRLSYINKLKAVYPSLVITKSIFYQSEILWDMHLEFDIYDKGRESFRYFLENYVEKTEMDLQLFMRDPSLIIPLYELILADQKNGHGLVEILSRSPSILNGELSTLIQSGNFPYTNQLLNLFSTVKPGKEYLDKIDQLFSTHMEEMNHLFNITSDHPSAFFRYLDKAYVVFDSKTDPLAKEFRDLLEFAKKVENSLSVDRFLFMEDRALASRILDVGKRDLQLAERLLDMVQAQYIPEVRKILDLREDLLASNRQLGEKLAELASSENGYFVKQVLQLDISNPVDKKLKKLILTRPIDENIKALFKLRARNHSFLSEAVDLFAKHSRTSIENTALRLIRAGRIALAKELLNNQTEPFFVTLSNIQSIEVMDKLRDLYWDLHAKNTQKEKIIAYALSIKDPKECCEWISKVQLLLSNEPKIVRMLEINDRILYDPRLLQESFQSNFNKIMPLGMAEPLKYQTDLSVAMAKNLLTENGINKEVVEQIKDHPSYDQLDISQQAHMSRVLDLIQNDPDFAEMIREIDTVPLPGSLEELFIRKTLGLAPEEKLSAHHVKLMVLSGLLWPLRQDDIGSCFITAICIEMASHAAGLKQLIKEYGSLITRSNIEKPEVGPHVGTVQYPMNCSAHFADVFQNQHLLVRAHEFTVAPMGASQANEMFVKAKNTILEHFSTAFENNLIIGGISAEDLEAIKKEVPLILDKRLEKLRVFFSTEIVNPMTGERGGWMIVDTEMKIRLEHGKFFGFYENLFKLVVEKLSERFPAYRDQLTSDRFDVYFAMFLSSDRFKEILYKDKPLKGLAKLNPLKYGHYYGVSPFLYYGGGLRGAEKYYSSPLREHYLHHAPNPLESLEIYLKTLTDQELAEAQNNPEFLKITSGSSHLNTLRLGSIMSLKKEGMKELAEKARGQGEKVASYVCPSDLGEKLKNCILDLHTDRGIYDFEIENRISKCKTIGDYCRAVLEVDKMMTGKDRSRLIGNYLDSELRRHPMTSGEMPPLYKIMDTNWRDDTTVCVTYFPADKKMRFISMNAKGSTIYSSWPGEDGMNNFIGCYYARNL